MRVRCEGVCDHAALESVRRGEGEREVEWRWRVGVGGGKGDGWWRVETMVMGWLTGGCLKVLCTWVAGSLVLDEGG